MKIIVVMTDDEKNLIKSLNSSDEKTDLEFDMIINAITTNIFKQKHLQK